jgi:predicted nucleic acid-binding protein
MPNSCGIYLDACCFIDMVKEAVGQTLTSDRSNDVWFLKQITQACRDGELDVYTSVISIDVKLVQPTPFIATDARDLRWRHGVSLRSADAIHVASALDRKCEEFVTTDAQAKKIAAKATLERLGLRVIRASETKCLQTKYLQLGLPGTISR